MESQQVKIEDLEGRVNENNLKNTTLKNVLVVQSGATVYVGEAKELYFEIDNDIRGTATLSRYDIIKSTKIKRRLVKFLPPTIESKEISVETEKLVWVFRSDKYNNKFFTSRGESIDKQANYGYKAGIASDAFDKGVTLSNKLLDMVFGPIDAKMRELYQEQIKRKKNFQ